MTIISFLDAEHDNCLYTLVSVSLKGKLEPRKLANCKDLRNTHFSAVWKLEKSSLLAVGAV